MPLINIFYREKNLQKPSSKKLYHEKGKNNSLSIDRRSTDADR